MKTRILYLHGFRSSPHSFKARHLAAVMAERGWADQFTCPFLSPVPAEALAQAEALLAEAPGPVTLVGSSLGGFYATVLCQRYPQQVKGAVLVNPAVLAHLSLQDYLGEQTNMYTGEPFLFTQEHVDQLATMTPAAIDPERYFVLLGSADEVLDYRDAQRRYAGARLIVEEGDDHAFTRFEAHTEAILSWAGLL